MTRMSASILKIFLLFWPFSATAQEVDVEQWNSARANLFSKVCMGSAPSFSGFAANAAEAGFVMDRDKLVFAPEVSVELISDIGLCRCIMVMGAPDPIALADEIFMTLLSDFPGTWGPEIGKRAVVGKAFFFDNVPVHLGIVPTSLETQPGIVATAHVKGDCPA